MQRRTLTPEIMDDPEIDGERHSHALGGLARINSVSFAATPVVRAIRKVIEPGPVHVLDIATGSGDVAHAVSKSLSRNGYTCSFTLTDISQRALDKTKLRFQGYTAETVTLDATQDALPASDVVMCSLFMHHLMDEQATALLGSMARAARRLLVVTDLRRTNWGLALARVVPKIVTRSDVVHVDAVKSARSAFTPDEFASLADSAQLDSAKIACVPPSRMMLTWRPKP